MRNKKMQQILENMPEIETVSSRDVPDIGLYMDQVTTFIEDRLRDYRRADGDKILTKTMINNYTKDKILPPPVKKKYSKNHVLLLILIYHLKNCITISDISALLSPLMDEKRSDQIEIKHFYDAFEKIQRTQKEKFSQDFEAIDTLVDGLNEDFSETEKNMLTAIALINEANERKFAAEKIIDKILKKS